MAKVDELVHVTGYQSCWPTEFATEHARIVGTLGLPPDDLQHIGSTAVPGLAAKPIVDLMLGVNEFPPPEPLVQSIVNLGYEALGEAGVPGRQYFRRRGQASANLGFWRMPYGRDEFSPVARDLASRGFAVWNLEYRRLGSPEGGWPGTLQGVAAGIDHLAKLVAEGTELDLSRVDQQPTRYAAASPIALLPIGVNQLIVHGAADEALPIEITRDYVQAAKAAEDSVQFSELPGASHMDYLDPGSEAHTTLCRWLEQHADTAALP